VGRGHEASMLTVPHTVGLIAAAAAIVINAIVRDVQ
jgi:hypothetical protein